MKTARLRPLLLLVFCLLIGGVTSCVTLTKLPAKASAPGQVKKVAGTKSAKPFAPGQQKKK